jgi:ABC-type antimicrobial peptide transport system permease subunit
MSCSRDAGGNFGGGFAVAALAIATIDELQANGTSEQRFHASLFSVFGALAVLLFAAGCTGLISQSIIERRHELDVRLAMGATARPATANIIRTAIAPAICGIAVGCVLAVVAVRFVRHLVWGSPASRSGALVAAVAILLLAAVAASLVPALRILKIDPSRTLRSA